MSPLEPPRSTDLTRRQIWLDCECMWNEHVHCAKQAAILSCILLGELKWHWDEHVHKTRVKIVKVHRNVCNVSLCKLNEWGEKEL